MFATFDTAKAVHEAPHPLPTPFMQQYLQCIYYDKSFKLRDCMNEIIHKWFYLLQSSSRRSTSGFLVCPWRVCSTAGRTSFTSSWSWSILGYMKISESISKVYSYEYDYYMCRKDLLMKTLQHHFLPVFLEFQLLGSWDRHAPFASCPCHLAWNRRKQASSQTQSRLLYILLAQ